MSFLRVSRRPSAEGLSERFILGGEPGADDHQDQRGDEQDPGPEPGGDHFLENHQSNNGRRNDLEVVQKRGVCGGRFCQAKEQADGCGDIQQHHCDGIGKFFPGETGRAEGLCDESPGGKPGRRRQVVDRGRDEDLAGRIGRGLSEADRLYRNTACIILR